MKHPSRALLGAGLLSFFVFLLVSFPARVAYRWFAPVNVQISGLEGSVWNGTAREMSAYGIYLLSPGWRMKPHYVVLGKLAYAMEGSAGPGFINTDIAVSLGGTVTKLSQPVYQRGSAHSRSCVHCGVWRKRIVRRRCPPSPIQARHLSLSLIARCAPAAWAAH